MIEFVGPGELLFSLFDTHRHLPALRDSVLEGRIGRFWVDDPESPRVARMDVGCYAFFGGDSELAQAEEAIRTVQAPVELVYPDESWRHRLLEVWGPRLRDWPMASFSPDGFSRSQLQGHAAGIADGYYLRRLRVDELAQLNSNLEPHGLQTFADALALDRDGMAWGSVIDGEVACAATSYAQSRHYVEVAIATRPNHRGRGLATATAAAFCLAALERGLRPLWNASNPVSKRLALRLGYRRVEDCITWMLDLERPH